MSLRLVIFDWDGTLANSLGGIAAAMAEAFRAHGLGAPSAQAVHAIVGRSLHLGIAELAGEAEAGQVDALAATYIDTFARRHAERPDALFDGAHELVTELAGHDHVILGIATGKERSGLDRVLAPTGIGHHFHTVQTADIAASKPHPEMVLSAMEAAGAAPDQTVVVGDSVLDMAMATAAGVLGLGVAWGSAGAEALQGAGAHGVAADFAELRAALLAFVALEAAGP